jgi:multidrug efflux system outer membrane protein
MSKLVSLLASAAVCLAGCTLIPEYTRPEPPIQAQWPTCAAYEKAYTAGSASADLPWRSYFTDPHLQALIETGLQNNRDLRTAALNVERARPVPGPADRAPAGRRCLRADDPGACSRDLERG